MYTKFYGLKEAPFNLTPNPRFYYSSAKHMEALSTLLYTISERKGFVVVSGDIGSGKTTICRTLLSKLNSKVKTALITNTRMSVKDLLMCILEEFEIDFKPGSKSKLHSQLNAYLIDQLRRDNNVVLIIDEAQNLSAAVLEEVRMLSNLETESEKLIQIVLMGQPELKQKLALPKLEQLCQRIAAFYHLTPFNKEDSVKYIKHRLSIASESDRDYFSDEAMDSIYEYSRGVPRLINQICDSALLTGYIKEAQKIDKDIVEEVIQEAPMTVIGRSNELKSEKVC